MSRVVPAELVNRWRMEKCDDLVAPTGIEYARFMLTFHARHGCRRFLIGLAYTSEVM